MVVHKVDIVLVLRVEVGIVAEDVTMRLSGLPGTGPSGGRIEDHALAMDWRVV